MTRVANSSRWARAVLTVQLLLEALNHVCRESLTLLPYIDEFSDLVLQFLSLGECLSMRVYDQTREHIMNAREPRAMGSNMCWSSPNYYTAPPGILDLRPGDLRGAMMWFSALRTSAESTRTF